MKSGCFLEPTPVPIDRIGLEIIDRKRKENNCMSVLYQAKHIVTAWKNGLGVYDKNNIEFVELKV